MDHTADMEGREMREWRQRHGISQDRLAALLGVNRVTVWRWEHDERAMPGRLVEWALKGIEAELPERQTQ